MRATHPVSRCHKLVTIRSSICNTSATHSRARTGPGWPAAIPMVFDRLQSR
jgi:hypothetical protein